MMMVGMTLTPCGHLFRRSLARPPARLTGSSTASAHHRTNHLLFLAALPPLTSQATSFDTSAQAEAKSSRQCDDGCSGGGVSGGGDTSGNSANA